MARNPPSIDAQFETVKQQLIRIEEGVSKEAKAILEEWGKDVVEHGNNNYVPFETGALQASGYADVETMGHRGKKKQVLTVGWGGSTPKPGMVPPIDNRNAPDGIVRYAGLQEAKHKFLFQSVRDKLPDLQVKARERYKNLIRTGKGGGTASRHTAPLRRG